MKMRPCIQCGGEIVLYSVCNPEVPYSAMAKCKKCKKEYPLPTVKLKTWKSNPCRISKTMVKNAEKAWNDLAMQQLTEVLK